MKTFFIYFVLQCASSSIHSKQSNWIKILLHHFLNSTEIHQLRLYKNTTEPNKFVDFSKFTKKLTQKFPTVKINLSTIPLWDNDTLKKSDSFRGSEPIIFVHDQSFDELNSQVMHFLNFYDKTFPKNTMPKCLVIYVKEQNEFSYVLIKSLLEYGWIKKFLDISVLEVSSKKNQAYIYTLNPFFDKLSKNFLSHRSKFFPNKLKNMNKYSLKLPIYQSPPYITMSKDEIGKTHLLNAYNYKFLNTILNQMNFYQDFIEMTPDQVSKRGGNLFYRKDRCSRKIMESKF